VLHPTQLIGHAARLLYYYYFGANINVGEQRLEVYVRSSFTVINLHDLRSNYPRSI